MVNINIPSNDTRTLIKTYLKILNVVNPNDANILTEGEIKILTEFIILPDKYSYQRFSRYAKPLVLKNLHEFQGWKVTPVNLNSKIYELLNKGYLWRDEDGVLYLKEFLIQGAKNLADSKIVIHFNDSKTDR